MEINGIIIQCTYQKMVPMSEIVGNPKNPNEHPPEQIKDLSDQFKFQGIRKPAIISKRSGFVATGHASIEAAKLLGMESYPCDFQDFHNEAHEYAYVVADNELQKRSKTNYDIVAEVVRNFDLKSSQVPIDTFAVPNLAEMVAEVIPEIVEMPTLESRDPDFQQVTFILSNEQKDILDDAMAKAKKEEDCKDEINQNSNGNVLAAILKRYIYG